ncbi:flavin-containing monooxygenase [Cryptococcus gattii Ru294]|nr:flavin-containing monooxygenase [Cryptococcus gattii Ru294]
MAPAAIKTEVDSQQVDVADLKTKIVNDQKEIEVESSDEKDPVAPNFMYDFKYNTPLPTFDREGRDFPANTDAQAIVNEFVENELAPALQSGIWRDKVAFTWTYRTFNFHDAIERAATDLLPSAHVENVTIIAPSPSVQRPYPDLSYIQAHLTLDTEQINASVVMNLLNTDEGIKIWTFHSVIEGLRAFPELPNRDGHMTGPISWAAQREKDTDFQEQEPDVVIVGGGHNGLMMAARLKALGVPTIIIEKNKHIGDNWRQRYEYLSLHFPHWADHFPYMPYPEHWPVYTPAGKLGDWLEWYASAMELHAWTGSSIVKCEQDANNAWTVEVDRGNKGHRIVKPKHVVIATSLCGVPTQPITPGEEKFCGVIRHSTAHDSSREWVGKKVLVVGTSSSGFDTAYDFARRDIDVTLLQRSPTYVMSLTHSVPRALGHYEPKGQERPDLDACDRISYATPVGPGEEMGRRGAIELEELDKEMLDGLKAKGFKTWRGQRATGVQTLGYTKNGGFYFEAGACQQIINGKVKVEQGYIEKFTEDKVILNGGREKEYDLVIMATGFSNTIDSIRMILGDDVAKRCNPIWGMDEEGEIKSAYRECGVPNLWIMVGTLQHGRYHSKRVALRIKGILEGVAAEPYLT